MTGPLSRLSRALTAPGTARAVGERAFELAGRRPATAGAPLDGAERVLVVRLDKIGDVVLSSAFLRELRRSLPSARIDLVVRPLVLPLVRHCPHVDRVFAFDPPAGSRWWRAARHARALGLAARSLWAARYDVALCPRFDADESHGAFVAYFSGAPRRAGWTERSTPARAEWNRGEDALLTDVYEDVAARHEADRNLLFLERVGGRVEDRALEVWPGPARGPGAPEPFAVLAPGADSPKRRWPVERFAAVGRALRDRAGLAIVVVGGPADRAAGRRLAAAIGPGASNFAGALDLAETAALLRRAECFVGNDTGTMHLAAAAGTRVVAISCHPRTGSPGHPNAPARFGARGAGNVTIAPERPASPCRDGCEAEVSHCILGVGVDDVVRYTIP